MELKMVSTSKFNSGGLALTCSKPELLTRVIRGKLLQSHLYNEEFIPNKR